MPGDNILTVEVTNISSNGLWMLIDDSEKFLSFEDFPWFRYASVDEILSVERLAPHHLYWEKLDVDIHTDSIDHPESYPLKAKVDRKIPAIQA